MTAAATVDNMMIGVEMATFTAGTIVTVISLETTDTETTIIIVEKGGTVVVGMIDRAEISITGLLRAPPAIIRKKICIPDWW